MYGHKKDDLLTEVSSNASEEKQILYKEHEVVDVEEEDSLEEEPPHENQCHLCKKQLSTKNELFDHVENHHAVYFQGMMEVAVSMKSKNFS